MSPRLGPVIGKLPALERRVVLERSGNGLDWATSRREWVATADSSHQNANAAVQRDCVPGLDQCDGVQENEGSEQNPTPQKRSACMEAPEGASHRNEWRRH